MIGRATFAAVAGPLLGLALACALGEDSTLDQECNGSEHCVFGQECVKTTYQSDVAQNPAGTGWCRPKGEGCKTGEQPGCECEIDGQSAICVGADVQPSNADEPNNCICEFIPNEMTSG